MSVMSQCYSIIIVRGISAPGHVKEVIDGINTVDKCYIYQLMSTVQLPGSNRFDSQMQIHTVTQKYDLSLAKEFQQHLTKKYHKDGTIDQGKNKKRFTEIKWTDRQYHVQDNSSIEHQDVRMYCNTIQFPELSFCGPYSKPHGAKGLSKYNTHKCMYQDTIAMCTCTWQRSG